MNSLRLPLPAPKMCSQCSCVLAADNDGATCSPCSAISGRQRWIVMSQNPSLTISAEDLATFGIYELILRNGTSTSAMISHLLNSGILPARLRRYEKLIVRLIDMPNTSHSSAARKLRVTRWTVAAWRKRLGLLTSTSTTTR
jgi:hypothetical protein